MDVVGSVRQLFRYPVKSLRGESVADVDVEARGVAGDRLWALRDEAGKLGSGKSSKRFQRMDGLLELIADYDGNVPVITFPHGRRMAGDHMDVHEALTAHVGVPVRLAPEDDVPHFDDGPIHLVTTASLRHLSAALGEEVDVRRFRPNLLVDTPELEGMAEDAWIGRSVAVGAVVLRVVQPMLRCVMTTHAQDALPFDPRVLRTITEINATNFGILAEVLRPGRVSVGDPVTVE